MNRQYVLVANRAAHRCEYCRAPEVVFNCPFEVEHILPRSALGLNELWNLALSCRACNVAKSDALAGHDPLTNSPTRLFDPRNDRWEDHFGLEETTARLLGHTEVGRATILQLRMNDEVKCAARQLWIVLGLFP